MMSYLAAFQVWLVMTLTAYFSPSLVIRTMPLTQKIITEAVAQIAVILVSFKEQFYKGWFADAPPNNK